MPGAVGWATLPLDSPEAWGAAAPVPILVLAPFPGTTSSAISAERPWDGGSGAAGAAAARRAGLLGAGSAGAPPAPAVLRPVLLRTPQWRGRCGGPGCPPGPAPDFLFVHKCSKPGEICGKCCFSISM